MLTWIPDVVGYLDEAPNPQRLQRLREAETIGRPAVSVDGMAQLELQMGRRLRSRRTAKKPNPAM